ncbi:bifunctional class I SAM-dependent methyltransferase/N-acetyltransferase [Amycolatopsis samaneae]|uniref:Bifunctional class I SAM-dependent methyltransferase/N-acetyltransferase n=1 Tax=Amycolatopsis samaneae TaxID=664691 RepID=A0ABW5GVJ4_9PSEU
MSRSSDHISAFFALRHGLPRQGPGSDATTRHLLRLAGRLPSRPRVLDVGCGSGRSALLLAAEAGADVVAVDTHQPFLDELTAEAARRGLAERVTPVRWSMAELPYADAGFDLIWAEGSAFVLGFDTALRRWRRLLAPDGVLVVTEAEWSTPTPSPRSRAFWDSGYPLRSPEENVAAAEAAGYHVGAHWPLPDEDWWHDCYTPLSAHLDAADPALPGMAAAIEAAREEISLRRDHGDDYHYAGYVLRPRTPHENGTTMTWHTRPETAADIPAIHAITAAAFPTREEADLVDALRADPGAWIDGLSWVAEAPDGTLAAHALFTRCHVDDAPALCLAPCSTLPAFQRQGGGSAAIRAGLDAAKALGENLVLVLGHPEYYPRFGFVPASRWGIRPSFEVPDEAMMALTLDPSRPVTGGVIRYPAAFGV